MSLHIQTSPTAPAPSQLDDFTTYRDIRMFLGSIQLSINLLKDRKLENEYLFGQTVSQTCFSTEWKSFV